MKGSVESSENGMGSHDTDEGVPDRRDLVGAGSQSRPDFQPCMRRSVFRCGEDDVEVLDA